MAIVELSSETQKVKPECGVEEEEKYLINQNNAAKIRKISVVCEFM